MNVRGRLCVKAVRCGVILACILLSGCDQQDAVSDDAVAVVPPPKTTKLLDTPIPLPAFELTERGLDTVSLETLKGKVWIAQFIFTSCSGQCPGLTFSMFELHKEFKDVPELQFVSVTVDPERDSPERLRRFADEFEADKERWHFLTGDAEAVRTLVVDGFKLALSENTDPKTSLDEPITHSGKFVLVDQRGRIRGYYGGKDNDDLDALRNDVKKVMKEAGK